MQTSFATTLNSIAWCSAASVHHSHDLSGGAHPPDLDELPEGQLGGAVPADVPDERLRMLRPHVHNHCTHQGISSWDVRGKTLLGANNCGFIDRTLHLFVCLVPGVYCLVVLKVISFNVGLTHAH